MKAKRALLALAGLFLCLLFPIGAWANSAEPPCFTVITLNPPADLSLSLALPNGGSSEALVLNRETKAWERYDRFFYHSLPGGQEGAKGASLLVRCAEGEFRCALPWDTFKTYNNLLSLDVAAQTLQSGAPPWRTPLLVGLRVGLSLLLEAAVFFLFGYRNPKSWLSFLILNLLTQGVVNALLTGPQIGSYWLFGYGLMEAFVFGTEMLAFAWILKEHSRRRALLCAFTANAASLLAGGALIAYLPI